MIHPNRNCQESEKDKDPKASKAADAIKVKLDYAEKPSKESKTKVDEKEAQGKTEQKAEGKAALPMTVTGCTAKSDPPMSAEKVKDLQNQIQAARKDQKAEKKQATKEKATSVKQQPKKGAMTAKSKAKAKAAPKHTSKSNKKNSADDEEESNTLDSEEPLESGDDLPPESPEDTKVAKAGFLFQ